MAFQQIFTQSFSFRMLLLLKFVNYFLVLRHFKNSNEHYFAQTHTHTSNLRVLIIQSGIFQIYLKENYMLLLQNASRMVSIRILYKKKLKLVTFNPSWPSLTVIPHKKRLICLNVVCKLNEKRKNKHFKQTSYTRF